MARLRQKKQPRKQTALGLRVSVCGEQISLKPNLICMLPLGVAHDTHTALALEEHPTQLIEGKSEEGRRAFKEPPDSLILVRRRHNQQEIEWLSVPPARVE